MASVDSAPAVAGGEPGPGPGPAPVRPRWRRLSWELGIALALAVTTITGALLTYLSIQRESAASDADQQAVIETILVEQRSAGAGASTYALGGLAARYRRMLAEAEALQASDPQRAERTRQVAAGLAAQSGLYEFLTGPGAAGRFDYDARLEAALHYSDVVAIPADQPARTAANADALRNRSRTLAMGAVGMLGVVVLLTVARVVRRDIWRIGLVTAAGGTYLAALIVGVVF
jgi:hypothetical protein